MVNDCKTWKLGMSVFVGALLGIGLTLFVLYILQLLKKASPFRPCPSFSCPVTTTCLLAVNWWKFPNSMWPNQRLTVKTKDNETDTLEKAQKWVLSQSKVLTYTDPDQPICTPIILSY